MDKKKLFVGSLPWSINDASLRELFAQFGEVVEAIVIMDRDSGRSKGFGFVTFTSEEDAQKAQSEMDQKSVEDRTIVVNFAKPKERNRDNFKRNNGFQGRRRNY